MDSIAAHAQWTIRAFTVIGKARSSNSDPGGVLVHGTYFGGANGDRLWDVTSTNDMQLYIVGRSASDQLFFPLKEFDTVAPEDWYDGDLSNSAGSTLLCYLAFTGGLEGRHYGWGSLSYCADVQWFEGGYRSDAIIASFDLTSAVTVGSLGSHEQPEIVWNTPTTYTINLPSNAPWEIQLTDLRGRILGSFRVAESAVRIDLATYPSGMYLVRGNSREGAFMVGKLVRP